MSSLRERLKKIAHSNKFFECLVYEERKIQNCIWPNYCFEKERRKREKGKNTILALERLKTLRGKYFGERCFIICTGPSLAQSDLNKLSGEYTFGMNSICKLKDWKPSFYGIQDSDVYEKMAEDVKRLSKEIPTFISTTIFKSDKNYFEGNDNVFYMPIYCADHLIHPISERFEFSKDCYDRVHDGYSIAMSLIQIAYYMGFREIYLIGADCNYDFPNGKNHFIEHGTAIPQQEYAGIRLIKMYEKIKEFAEANDLKIYNATRGGSLEVFERVNLDEIQLKEGCRNE